MGDRNRRWTVYGLLFLSHIYFFQVYPRWLSPNEFSRFLLISAVVDYGTLQIDKPIQQFGDTQDKAFFNGHFYSDKAIGVSLLGIVPYLFLKCIESLFHFRWHLVPVLLCVRILTVTIPALILLRTLEKFWMRMRPGSDLIPHFLFLFAFGTIAFTYSLQLVGHHLLAIFLFLSFYCAHSSLYSSGADQSKRLLLSGSFAGIALTLEFPAVFPVAAILAYVFWSLPEKRKGIWFLVSIAPFLILLLGYNFAIFGTPFDVVYRHKVDPSHIRIHSQDLVGIGLPRAQALYELLFSTHHGLFFWSPFLLFSIPGFYFLVTDRKWFREGWLFVAIGGLYILIHGGYSDWIGGWSFGPRYITPVIPFLTTAAFVLFSEERIRALKWVPLLGVFLGLISFFHIIIGTITFPFPPAELEYPFSQLNLPLFFQGAFGLNLGDWLPLPSFGTALLFFTLLLIVFLLMTNVTGVIELPRPKDFAGFLAVFILAACLVLTGYFSARIPSAFENFALGRAYYFLGHNEFAYREFKAALSRHPDERLTELILWYLNRLNSPGPIQIR